MLGGEVMNVIEAIGVLEIARRADLGGHFHFLAVTQSQRLIVRF